MALHDGTDSVGALTTVLCDVIIVPVLAQSSVSDVKDVVSSSVYEVVERGVERSDG